MSNAIFGLIGVIVGAMLTVLKDLWFEHRRNQKEVEFLSIHVVCLLEQFIDGCIDVIYDDGLYQGQYGNDGTASPQTSTPLFEPQSLKVEWKVLPSNLMYEVLNFPEEMERANRKIRAVYEYEAVPPDYDDFFGERQYQYALLGLKAFELSNRLRKIANLPKYERQEYDPIEIMVRRKTKFEHYMQLRVEEHAKKMKNLEL